MSTNKKISKADAKNYERNVRIIGASFAIGGIGFAILFTFNPVAVVFGSFFVIVGIAAIIRPRSIKSIMLILAEILSIYP